MTKEVQIFSQRHVLASSNQDLGQELDEPLQFVLCRNFGGIIILFPSGFKSLLSSPLLYGKEGLSSCVPGLEKKLRFKDVLCLALHEESSVIQREVRLG